METELILPQLEAIERAMKALIPLNGRGETFRAAAAKESLGQVAGILYSIEECARLLRNTLEVKLDIFGDAQSKFDNIPPSEHQ